MGWGVGGVVVGGWICNLIRQYKTGVYILSDTPAIQHTPTGGDMSNNYFHLSSIHFCFMDLRKGLVPEIRTCVALSY